MRLWCARIGWALMAALPASALSAQCDRPIDLGRGAVAFEVPNSYDPQTPAPLVILLHGRGADGESQDSYFRFGGFAEKLGFLYSYPDGDLDAQGALFWNGTDACCDFFGSGVDHSSYLRELIETIRAQCNVDPYRIYFVGHSNGGFMAYRMACDHADTVAGIASLAGMSYFRPEDCSPSDPVHVLHIHGTFDALIRYAGGMNGAFFYPGARQSIETWAEYNGCADRSKMLPELIDLDDNVGGVETQVERWNEECRPGGSAELWSIVAGGHVPAVTDTFRRGVLEHLLAHPACRKERLKRVKCNNGTVKVKLRKGVPGDAYRIESAAGLFREGALNAKGKATVRLRDQPPGAGEIRVTWGCGARSARGYRCLEP